MKNERDQFDELNRRLKMELQRVQQQTYADKGLIKQLQDKLSQADNTEREWMTKYNREKDKVSDHLEKITVVENTVTTLEKQTRDYVHEIEVGKSRNMEIYLIVFPCTARHATDLLQVVNFTDLSSNKLANSSSCSKFVKIRVVTNCHLQNCYEAC